jgi:HTH-type transcriptional regulator / antitoxin HigA
MQKVIKTETEYRLALNRVEKLMDARPGTAEFDDLELLSALIEIYEEKHYPINMPDPVNAIRFRMEQLGLNQQDLVPFIGSRSKVSEVLNRKRNLNLSMIRSLNKGLGIPSDVLLRDYDAFANKDDPQLEYDKFPIKEMIKKGWIPEMKDIEKGSEEIIKDMISNAGGMRSVECCLFRRSKNARENAKNDTYALTAWCLKVLEIAKRQPLSRPYVEESVDAGFLHEVAKLSYFDDGPVLAKEYLAKHGIQLITLPHLNKTYLDGVVIASPNQSPVIGLTLRYDRMDNFWFCLLHELAHLSKHAGLSDCGIIVDDLDLRKYDNRDEDSLEQQADFLAQEALIPGEERSHLDLKNDKLKPIQIQELAGKLKISPSIIAGRIRYETNNYKKFSNLLGHGQVRRCFADN